MFEIVSHGENGIQHLAKIETGLTTTNGTEYRTRGLRNPHNCQDTEIVLFFLRTLKNAFSAVRLFKTMNCG